MVQLMENLSSVSLQHRNSTSRSATSSASCTRTSSAHSDWRGASFQRSSRKRNFGGEFGVVCVTVEVKVFWLKMKGDYFGYLAEFEVGDARKNVAELVYSC
ncbi:putative 14-3-3 domain superfamily protein [Helianthus anomalus]